MQLLKPFIGHSGQIRERLEGARQPLPGRGYGGSSHPSVWIQLYTSAEFQKLGVPRDGSFGCLTFYIHGSMNMEL
jgi:hypothetical protein